MFSRLWASLLALLSLLRSHAACQPGVFLVSLQASSGSAGILLMSKTPSACHVPYLYNVLAFFADSMVVRSKAAEGLALPCSGVGVVVCL